MQVLFNIPIVMYLSFALDCLGLDVCYSALCYGFVPLFSILALFTAHNISRIENVIYSKQYIYIIIVHSCKSNLVNADVFRILL